MRSRPNFMEGVRGSVPLVLPTLAIGISFGVLGARLIGPVPSLVMSALVWSGTAQFAALTVLSGGAGLGLAASAGLLANTRYLPMGFALAPSLHGGRLRGAAVGVTLADASFALSRRRDGFDAQTLVGAAPLQYAAWVGGTAVGVAGAIVAADPEQLGLDVLFPVFYVALLVPELKGAARRGVLVAAVSAVITVALTPLAPQGVPVLVATSAALIGLLKPGGDG
jgi:predicted branched-subunit amino acid permease